MNAELLKRWKTSDTLLKRAYAALPRPPQEGAHFSALELAFKEYLYHNEHGLALDVLEELGNLTTPRGGFWKDLMRAAENMELLNRIPPLREKFHQSRSQ